MFVVINICLLAHAECLFSDAESNICKYNEMIINDITLF